MPEDNSVNKMLEWLKNHPVISVIILVGIIITAVSEVFSSIRNALPENSEAENYCNDIEQLYASLNDNFEQIKNSEIGLAEAFNFCRLLTSFSTLQDKFSNYDCQIFKQKEFRNQIIKDKTLGVTFKLVEKWNKIESQNQDTSEIKDVIKSLCECTLEFMNNTNQQNEKEISVLKNTIQLCKN